MPVSHKKQIKELESKIRQGIAHNIYGTEAELDRDLVQLDKLVEEEMYVQSENNLYQFFINFWDCYDPNPLVKNWHLECLCEHIQAALDRKLRRLIVNISPRSSKSTIGSISSVCWQLLNKSEEKFWLISHSHKLFMQNIVYARRILDHPKYKTRWMDKNNPNYKFSLTKDQNTKTRIETSTGGYILGGSPDSGALGMGYTVAILDDVLDSQQATNIDQVEKVNQWYTQTFMNRSNDVNTDVVIILMQRLAPYDITNYVLETYGDQDWFLLNIPAKYDPDRTFVSPIGYNDKRTVRNELMDAVRLPDSFLSIQAKNPIIYNTRYQQNPSALSEGNFVKAEWVKETDTIPLKFHSQLVVWDLSFGDSPEGSYTVGLVLGKYDDKIYIIDMLRDKLAIPGQLEAVRKLRSKYPHAIVGIEKRANGNAVMSLLEREISNIYAFQPRLFGGSKEQRLNSTLEYFRREQVLIYNPFTIDTRVEPTYSPETIKAELLSFPLSLNDDIVDCIGYGVQYLIQFGQESLALISNGEPIIFAEDEISVQEWLKMSKLTDADSDNFLESMTSKDYIYNLFE